MDDKKNAKRGAGKNKRSELIKQGINCAKCLDNHCTFHLLNGHKL